MRLTTVPVMAAVLLAAVAALGSDTITTTNGDKITGKIVGFMRHPSDPGKSWFLITAQGKEKTVVLDDIGAVVFSGHAIESKPSKQGKAEASAGGEWWLSSSGKRHNSGCRYYKTSKGRACGADDGVPCKVCGG